MLILFQNWHVIAGTPVISGVRDVSGMHRAPFFFLQPRTPLFPWQPGWLLFQPPSVVLAYCFYSGLSSALTGKINGVQHYCGSTKVGKTRTTIISKVNGISFLQLHSNEKGTANAAWGQHQTMTIKTTRGGMWKSFLLWPIQGLSLAAWVFYTRAATCSDSTCLWAFHIHIEQQEKEIDTLHGP